MKIVAAFLLLLGCAAPVQAQTATDPANASTIQPALLNQAAQGDATAQFNIGLMYMTGRGVTQDDAQALTWIQKSANGGYAVAQNLLGVMYMEGRGGVTQSNSKAISWFQKAAAQGYVNAQLNLNKLQAP